MRVISANKPLRSPEDLRHLTLRIEPSKVGAIPASPGPFRSSFHWPIPGTPCAANWSRGRENAWSNIYSQGFQTLQTDITETNHSFQGYMLITSKTFWNGLPTDLRSELDTILAQVTEEVKTQAAEQADRDRQAILAAGKTRIYLY